MANVKNASFFGPNNPSIMAQQRQIEQSKALADALSKAGSEQSQTEFAGGIAVPQSPMVGLGKMAQVLAGAYINKKNQDSADKMAIDSWNARQALFGATPYASPQADNSPSLLGSLLAPSGGVDTGTSQGTGAIYAPPQPNEAIPLTDLPPNAGQQLATALQPAQQPLLGLEGMTPDQASMIYGTDPELFRQMYSNQHHYTDQMLNDRYTGIAPAARRSLTMASGAKDLGVSGGMPNIDNSGNMTVTPIPGAAETNAGFQGAATGAQEAAKAGYDLIDVSMPDGTTRKMTRGQAANLAKTPAPQSAQTTAPMSPENAATTTALFDPQYAPGIPVMSETEKASQNALNNDFVDKSYRPTLDAGANARASNQQLEALEKLDITGDTGWGTDTKTKAANVLTSFGLSGEDATKNAADAQVFRSIVSTRVNDRLMQQKGPQTDQDALRAREIEAQLGNRPEANKFIISLAKATNNLAQEKAKFYSENAPKYKNDMSRVEAEWQKQAPSIWSDPVLKDWGNIKKAAPANEGVQPAKRPMPKIGDVIDGHIYKGGNPNDPKSWGAQ